ncbi:hypothetical protein [Desulfosoma sp.]|uniref:hypothetical protein n=1 Tax=Desulfosoma sp. TaxID=2603217 RepID=UPI00404A7032
MRAGQLLRELVKRQIVFRTNIEKNLEPLRHAITAILPPLEELEKEIAEDDDNPRGG